MKKPPIIIAIAINLLCLHLFAQTNGAQGKNSTLTHQKPPVKKLYIDIHHFGPGKVAFADVAKAHAKDLAVQKKYGVRFLKYWVDEAHGDVYCLSSSPDTLSIHKTHAEAHGLMPQEIYVVKSGKDAALISEKNFFMDVHELGAGKVKAKDVAAVHLKDLAVEKKHGVNIVNYWLNEKSGTVLCLSQAPDSAAIIKSHAEAHGMLPAYVVKVKASK